MDKHIIVICSLCDDHWGNSHSSNEKEKPKPGDNAKIVVPLKLKYLIFETTWKEHGNHWEEGQGWEEEGKLVSTLCVVVNLS